MIKKLAILKFKFDLGASFVPIATLTFSVIAASDKITTFTGLPAKVIVPVCVVGIVVIVPLVGHIFDLWKFPHHYQTELNNRNEMLKDIAKK